jgi:hypothetical protein
LGMDCAVMNSAKGSGYEWGCNAGQQCEAAAGAAAAGTLASMIASFACRVLQTLVGLNSSTW